MVTYLALWTRPEDVDGFEREYTEDHLPLAQALPGVRRCVAARVADGNFYRVVEVEFDSVDALQEALSQSEEGKLVRENSQHLQATYGVTVERMILHEWQRVVDATP